MPLRASSVDSEASPPLQPSRLALADGRMTRDPSHSESGLMRRLGPWRRPVPLSGAAVLHLGGQPGFYTCSGVSTAARTIAHRKSLQLFSTDILWLSGAI